MQWMHEWIDVWMYACCLLFFKEIDDIVYFSSEFKIVFNGIFDFIYGMKDSGMMFASEFITDFVQGGFG